MSVQAVAHPGVVGRPMPAAHYDTLVRAGSFEDDAVELLEGVVVDMAPQGEPHSDAVGRVTNRLVTRLGTRFGEQYMVRPQTPLRVSDISRPEPDIAIIDWHASTGQSHPATAHLVIEISQTSQARDLDDKPRIYAGAAVTQYWVVDLVAREVVVHTDPLPADPRTGRWATYGTVRHLPWDTELDVLGMTLRVCDLL